MVEKLTRAKRRAEKLQSAFWISSVFFFWAAFAYFLMKTLTIKPAPGAVPNLGEFFTVLFGASTLATVIVTIVIGVGALLEWRSLKADVGAVVEAAETAQEESARATRENQERVKELAESLQRRLEQLGETVSHRVKGLEKEVRGRAYASEGVTLGTLYADRMAEEQKEENKGYLAEAIHSCQRGFEILEEIAGNGKFMALNNVVYFSSLLGTESRRERERLLAQARRIREVAEKYPESPWNIPYLLTYCRAVSTFGSDPDELSDAIWTANELSHRKLTVLQGKEAELLKSSLQKRLGALKPTGDSDTG